MGSNNASSIALKKDMDVFFFKAMLSEIFPSITRYPFSFKYSSAPLANLGKKGLEMSGNNKPTS